MNRIAAFFNQLRTRSKTVAQPVEQAVPGVTTTNLRFAVLGNCQIGHLTRCLQALTGGSMPPGLWVTPEKLAEFEQGSEYLESTFAEHDKVFMQPWIWSPLAERYARWKGKVVLYPNIGFMAYHPDLVPVLFRDTGVPFEGGPCLRCNSSIAFLGWKAGLSASATVQLFNRETFRRLGFFEYWDSSVAVLMEEGRKCGISLEVLFDKWRSNGCFLHDHVHPKVNVYGDIARLLLANLGIPVTPGDPIQYVHDYLANGIIWPVYPEIAELLGGSGNYMFKLLAPRYLPDKPINVLGLEEMVKRSFEAYSSQPADSLTCMRLDLPSYQDLLLELKQNINLAESSPISTPAATAEVPNMTSPTPLVSHGGHPYRGLPPNRFWRSAVSQVAIDQIDPVTTPRFTLTSRTPIAAAGSCFAQHIAHRLSSSGFNFLRTETSASDSADSGSYSARYGNIYTARQLLQLMERAYGRFEPEKTAWLMPNGRYADPFRPQIEPEGFASIVELEAARAEHLAAVRRMFETLSVLVFTLGLTEAWRAKADGSVFPLAPGVAAGAMDTQRYEFVNFTETEVTADLALFLDRLLQINPNVRVILTVSPVALSASYADRHVLVSNTYSKAVLRVAAERISQQFSCCDYFPSYEIITGSFNRGRYYAEDLRTVTPEGVNHVMRLFLHHYANIDTRSAVINPDMLAETQRALKIVCEEELLAAAISQ